MKYCYYAQPLYRKRPCLYFKQMQSSAFSVTPCDDAKLSCSPPALLQQHSKLRAYCCVHWDANAGPVHCQVVDVEVGVQLLVPVEHHHSPRAALQGSRIYLHERKVSTSIRCKLSKGVIACRIRYRQMSFKLKYSWFAGDDCEGKQPLGS